MIVTIGLAVALVLSLIEEFQAAGKSLVGWACVIGFGVLLFSRIA